MASLRIILIILGIIVIAFIYFWERHKNKINLEKKVILISEEDDDPDMMISIKKDDKDDHNNLDLADLKDFMRESSPEETQPSPDDFKINGSSDEPGEQDEQSEPSMDEEKASQEIVILHIIAHDEDKISGNSLLSAAESLGFKFGDMNVFHFYPNEDTTNPEIHIRLVDMYEPGTFKLDTMDDFNTRGVSIFACLEHGKQAQQNFEEMLEIGELLAKKLNAKLCGPDRQAINNKIINQIRLTLGENR